MLEEAEGWDIIHVWQLQAALRRARWYTLVGAVLVAVGAAGFLSVTGEQGTTYVPVLTLQITTSPRLSTADTGNAASLIASSVP